MTEEIEGAASFEQWLDEVYPKIWHEAYAYGEAAKEEGLPRECNLNYDKFGYATHDGGNQFLKPWKSAWEQGYDGYKIPAVFAQVENYLNQLPTRPMTEDDLQVIPLNINIIYVEYQHNPDTIRTHPDMTHNV